ncbi:hypothetical protein FACS1894166_01090 [Bacilli bacterium]|nr:hypothetical protein FACS1894166_01090 [Bacilli bacterium]
MSDGVLPDTTPASISLTLNPILNFAQITLDDNTRINVRGGDDFNKLCNTDLPTASITVNGTTFVKNSLTGFTFGSEFNLTAIPDDFLCRCTTFNQALTIPNSVETIGADFLSHCESFDRRLTIPDSVNTIGAYFLE